MEETKSQAGEMEKVDELIAVRLIERQRKIERMKAWEAAPSRSRRWVMVVSTMSVAACLVVVFFTLRPASMSSDGCSEVLMPRPDMTAYRAACSELTAVENSMDAGDYEKALVDCEVLLFNSDTALVSLQHLTGLDVTDEELAYEFAAKSLENHYIRWVYIYLLLQSRRNDEVLRQLDLYIKDGQNCECYTDAVALKGKLIGNIKKIKKKIASSGLLSY